MNALSLFAEDEPADHKPGEVGPDAIDFVPTPSWFAYAMVERYVARLERDAIVCEPCAGNGQLLREIPSELRAFGVERDATLAAQARLASGREVLVGDVLSIELPQTPTALISNPPFRVDLLTKLLERFHPILPDGSTITLLLPVYTLQNSPTVARYASRYSLSVELIPRDIFLGSQHALCISTFCKESPRRLIGMAFFPETFAWRQMSSEFRDILARAQRNVWVDACLRALERLGGTGTVEQIAQIIEGHKPTRTQWWRQAIRKHLGRYFERVSEGLYTIPRSIPAA